MAYASTDHASHDLRHTLARPFVALGKMLIALTEASTMAKQANRIAEMSDETLAAKGTTRKAEIARVFAAYSHV